MSTPFRNPAPPPAPRVRYRWYVNTGGSGFDHDFAPGGLMCLILASWACDAALFVWHGAVPRPLRWALVNAVATAVWALVYVRRRPV